MDNNNIATDVDTIEEILQELNTIKFDVITHLKRNFCFSFMEIYFTK